MVILIFKSKIPNKHQIILEESLKEIRVDKVLKEINSCKFSTGLSTLKAIKK